MAIMLLDDSTRRNAHHEDQHWHIKALLRVAAVPLAMAVIGLFLACIFDTLDHFVFLDGTNDWTDGLPLAPAMISFFYNPIVLILGLIIRQGRLVHPGLTLGMDLLIWILLVPAIVYAVDGAMFWQWSPVGFTTSDGFVDCTLFLNAWSQTCAPKAYTIGRMQIAGVVCMGLLFFIHLLLSIGACIDLHRRRTAIPPLPRIDRPVQYRKGSDSRSQES